MSYALTTNWGDIQKRTVDPYDNVNSDVVNQVYKVFGSGHAFVEGFGIVEQYLDALENRVAIKLEKGIAYVGGILIQITADTTINLFTVPNTVQQDYYIVLEYEFSKSQPIPQAIIRSVKAVDYSSNKQLILHKYTVPIYIVVPSETSWNTWISDQNNYKDYRFNTGYIKRKGDIVTGPLVLNFTPSMDSHAVSKKWVEDFIGSAGGTFNPNLYLKKSGGTVNGPLICGTGGFPSSLNEYVTKNYVDTTTLKLSGGNMSGSLILQKNNYLAGDNAAIDKKFSMDTFVSKSGSTMTGMLILNQDPITPMGAATKQYVDSHSGGSGGVPADAVMKSGDTMIGYLTLNSDPVTALHAATKGYVDQKISEVGGGSGTVVPGTYVLKTGDTITGPLILPDEDPVADSEAVRKKYVDDQITNNTVNKSGGSFTGPVLIKGTDDKYIELNSDVSPAVKIVTTGGDGSFQVFNKTDNQPHFALYTDTTGNNTVISKEDLSVTANIINLNGINGILANRSTAGGPTLVVSSPDTSTIQIRSDTDSSRIELYKGSDAVARIYRMNDSLVIDSFGPIYINGSYLKIFPLMMISTSLSYGGSAGYSEYYYASNSEYWTNGTLYDISMHSVFELDSTGSVVMAKRDDTSGSEHTCAIMGVRVNEMESSYSFFVKEYGDTSHYCNLVMCGSTWVRAQTGEIESFASLEEAKNNSIGKMAVVSSTVVGTVTAMNPTTATELQLKSKVGYIFDVDYTNKLYHVKISLY